MDRQPASPPHGIYSVTDFGAHRDGQTLDTPAIQSAIEACHQAGGGTVYFPAGEYLTGSIFLRDRISLWIDAGARLLGSQDLADYPVIPGRWEGVSQPTYASLISGSGLRDVAVTGRGTIDGRGAMWWQLHRLENVQGALVRACQAAPGTGVFLALAGAG